MEQSISNKLVEDNLKLVYYLFQRLRHNTLTDRYKDDIISEGMIGLVKAARSYDEKRGTKFSTYAALCIRNEMLMFLRRLNRQIPCEVSLSEQIGHDQEGNPLCLEDVLEDESQTEERIIERLMLEDFEKRQSPIDRKIIEGIRQGKRQKEIGAELMMCQAQVSRRLRKMRSKSKKI